MKVNIDDEDVIEISRSILRMDNLVELTLDLKENKVKQRSA